MATLLMWIEAPMQSWGISSLFTDRDSTREPSKSGVIGLICAALGRPREADISDLNTLRLGVRVDREGRLENDFQTARNILKSDKSNADASAISTRYYLADAAFLVGLEGEMDTLTQIQKALKTPIWSLYLGRKAFPPSKPVYLQDGLNEEELEISLCTYRLQPDDEEKRKRLVIEAEDGEFRRQDVPLNFAERTFLYRRVKVLYRECGEKGEW